MISPKRIGTHDFIFLGYYTYFVNLSDKVFGVEDVLLETGTDLVCGSLFLSGLTCTFLVSVLRVVFLICLDGSTDFDLKGET